MHHSEKFLIDVDNMESESSDEDESSKLNSSRDVLVEPINHQKIAPLTPVSSNGIKHSSNPNDILKNMNKNVRKVKGSFKEQRKQTLLEGMTEDEKT